MSFQYCPKCKAHLTEPAARHVVCKKCGFDFYINPAPTSTVILKNSDGKILFVKRKYPPKQGWWDLPGGFLEFGESAEEGAVRELEEEIGVTIHNLKYLAARPDRYLFRGYNYHTVNIIFTAQTARQNFYSGDDVSAIAFFHPHALPWRRIAFTNARKALKEYSLSLKRSRV